MTNHFLQSKAWEEFQKSVGREVFRIDGALVVKLPLAFGKNYFYCGGCLTLNVKQAKELAKQENAVFLKLEPMQSTGTPQSSPRLAAGQAVPVDFKKSGKEVQPQKTIVLDIRKSEEELLGKMREKTRYNIRLARKKNLRFVAPEPRERDLEKFWQILQKTTQRDKFSSHSREYYKKLLESPLAKLLTVEYRGKVIAASIVLSYKDRATYLHGASDYAYRSFMASYLLHWETIKYAKEGGYAEYDLWGVDETKWPGVTRFKRGFGGQEVEYVGSYDYAFSNVWYGLYRLRQFIR